MILTSKSTDYHTDGQLQIGLWHHRSSKSWRRPGHNWLNWDQFSIGLKNALKKINTPSREKKFIL